MTDSEREYRTVDCIEDEIRNWGDKEYESWCFRASKFKYYGYEPKDLLQESLLRIFEGKRKCPIDVSLEAFIFQTMRSIAFEGRSEKYKSVELDENILGVAEDGVTRGFDESQREAIIRRSIDGDDECLLLFGAILIGKDKKKIMSEQNWDDNKFATVRRRLKRKTEGGQNE